MRRRLLTNPIEIDSNGVDYVDMGLSVIWATCNIGAESPEEYGLYFQWGDTVGWRQDQVGSDKVFNWSTYKHSQDGTGTSASGANLIKYCNNSTYGYNGFTDTLTVLEPEDDAAVANLGGNWRMPTSTEYNELINACNTTWTTMNGVYGRLFTLKSNSSKTLFFPASGDASGSSMSNVGSYGYYWTSSLYTSGCYSAWSLYFNSSNCYVSNNDSRYRGRAVRGVLGRALP